MKVIKAPETITLSNMTIFLAGSIEMGAAELWQDKVTNALQNYDVTILNPRRDDWDSSWTQEKTNPQFREQVEWELSAQELSDLTVMYFDPKTKSPITLLELGLFSGGPLLVCCPKGFWRKGNIDIVCERYRIPLFETLDELINTTILKIERSKY